MRISDLKRAVEDVILRPDENPLVDLGKRDTIAALDLCQQVDPTPTINHSGPTAASMNATSCSSETVPREVPPRPPPQLCTSTSLDTIVLRNSFPSRPSAGVSRRSSRVLPHYTTSKRKRSNSVSSCYKGQPVNGSNSLPPTARNTPFRFGDGEESQSQKYSLANSDSHSSVAQSEDYVREEDELELQRILSLSGPSSLAHPSSASTSVSPCIHLEEQSSTGSAPNPFLTFRDTRPQEFDDDCMDCD